MEKWILYALISMVFAGFTAVIAKLGLTGISGDLGLAIRTCFVFVFTLLFAAAVVPRAELAAVSTSNVVWLGLSAITTTVSWVFYYKAIKLGEVSSVALIDKGSVIVSVLLAVVILREALTMQKVFGAVLVVSGIVVIARSA
jgi:transporter family protein